MADRMDKQLQRLFADYPNLDSTTALTVNDLPFIRIATITVCSHWYNLGIFFHLSTNFLDELRVKFRQNADRCLTAVLAEWLKNTSYKTGPPTWKTVATAVASRVGGDNPSEARKIARDFDKYNQRRDFKGLDEVDNRSLTSRDLISVKATLLEGVADKWIAIGLLLGIPYHRLEVCEMEDTLNHRITQMITEWLNRRYDTVKFGEPSWRKLVEVIASRAGGSHNYLATQLAKQHPFQPVQEGQDQVEEVSPSSSRSTGPPPPRDVLSEADLAMLMELLRPVSAKWNLLGLQLGVPMDEIQIIMAKPLLMAGAPLSYLQETLYVWLQQRPPSQAWPTVDVLCSALCGDVLDSSTLASEVRTAMLGRK